MDWLEFQEVTKSLQFRAICTKVGSVDSITKIIHKDRKLLPLYFSFIQKMIVENLRIGSKSPSKLVLMKDHYWNRCTTHKIVAHKKILSDSARPQMLTSVLLYWKKTRVHFSGQF